MDIPTKYTFSTGWLKTYKRNNIVSKKTEINLFGKIDQKWLKYYTTNEQLLTVHLFVKMFNLYNWRYN